MNYEVISYVFGGILFVAYMIPLLAFLGSTIKELKKLEKEQGEKV